MARASLEELLLDYEDFLRQRGMVLWDRDAPAAAAVRRRAWEDNRSYVEESSPGAAANARICLIQQTDYLLDQQLRQLERDFLQAGGFTERLYSVRGQRRRTWR